MDIVDTFWNIKLLIENQDIYIPLFRPSICVWRFVRRFSPLCFPPKNNKTWKKRSTMYWNQVYEKYFFILLQAIKCWIIKFIINYHFRYFLRSIKSVVQLVQSLYLVQNERHFLWIGGSIYDAPKHPKLFFHTL